MIKLLIYNLIIVAVWVLICVYKIYPETGSWTAWVFGIILIERQLEIFNKKLKEL